MVGRLDELCVQQYSLVNACRSFAILSSGSFSPGTRFDYDLIHPTYPISLRCALRRAGRAVRTQLRSAAMMESNTGLQAGRAGEIANDIAASLALSDASQVKQESLVDMDLSEQLVQPAVTLHVTSAPVPVLNTVLTAGQTAALAVPVPEARPEESEVKPELNDVWMDNGISGQEHAEVIKVEPDVDGETTTTAVSQMAVEAGSSFNMAATPSLIADDTQQSSPNVLTPASSGGAATEIPGE